MSEQERGQLALPDVDEPEAPATERSARPEQPFGDLSEAARGVVHEPADPRLEKHLARIGLGDAEAAAAARAPAGSVDPGIAGQLAEIKASDASASNTPSASRSRKRKRLFADASAESSGLCAAAVKSSTRWIRASRSEYFIGLA